MNWSIVRIGWIIGNLIPILFAATIAAIAALLIHCGFSFRKWRKLHDEVILSAVFAIGFTAAFLLVADHSLPRYCAVVILPVALVLANELYGVKYQKIIATLFILLQFANTYGALLPHLPDIYCKEGSMLERSREFLGDLDANRQIMALLEREAPHHAVVAKIPYLPMLTIPEFRYVRKPLKEVYSVGLHPSYAPVKPYSPGETPANALILFAPDTLWGAFSLRPVRESSILFVENEDHPARGIILYTNEPQ